MSPLEIVAVAVAGLGVCGWLVSRFGAFIARNDARYRAGWNERG